MAITYKLEDQRVTFHWDHATDLWTAKSEDIEDLDIEAKSFSALLKMLKHKHPEFSKSIRIFFPDLAQA